MIYAVPDGGSGFTPRDESMIVNNTMHDNLYGIVLMTNPNQAPLSNSCRISTMILHNTISHNRYEGISLFNYDSEDVKEIEATIVNNIIALSEEGIGILEDNPFSDPFLVDSNDIFMNAGGLYLDEGVELLEEIDQVNLLPEANNEQGKNFEDNPSFISTPSRDYHLVSVSLCIDRADPDFMPVEDMDGDPRPFGGLADVGADEFRSDINLVRAHVEQIYPHVDPPISEILPLTDPGAHVIVYGFRSGETDPELGILENREKPLVFYMVYPPADTRCRLTKDEANRTVRINFE
jgi:hypothetical protein